MTFLGRPISHWLFGLRIWLSMMLALAVAFWLQLDGASSALTTVTILALPMRGQALSKALHRLFGTAVGLTAAIVIAGLFADVRTLFIPATAAWLALCVFAANMLDDNRAYAAVLSGYTVAIVAAANIDSPQNAFNSGINRAAAIAIGIVAVAFVNDLFGAPNVLVGLVKQIEAAHVEVRAFALRALDRETSDPVDVAHLIGRLTSLRADALALPGESVAGRARSAAARRAITELVREARAARMLGASLPHGDHHGAGLQPDVAAALDDPDAARRLLLQAAAVIADGDASAPQLIAARAMEDVVNCDRAVAAAITDLVAGRGPGRGPRLKLYHPLRGAARNALRTFLAVVVGATILIAAGLPTSSASLTFICVLAGLSANTPEPRTFIRGALVAIPIAATIAGVTLFFVLDGADAFPLLGIALLPTVLAGCLLMASGKLALAGLGFFLTVFTPVLLSLANPQRYDPSVFLNESLFIVVSATLLAVAVNTVLPTDDARRRGWMLRATRRELRFAVEGRPVSRLNTEEASFRAADRLGQLAALHYPDDGSRSATLAHALHLSEITFATRWTRDALAEDGGSLGDTARAALATLDPALLRAAGADLRGDVRLRWAGAGAIRLAVLIERYAGDLALARAGGTP